MKILVGISGGVDSAVTAYLLKQQGHNIVGGFMLNYLDENDPNCSTKNDLESFYQVCSFLNIPYEILDFRKEYEERILNYIYEGYLQGITPNPDVLCNTEIKFKLFLDEAIKLGYDMIATGHYAQIVRSCELGVRNSKETPQPHIAELQTESNQTITQNSELRTQNSLLRGTDNQKDQSYFLAGLNQFQLSKALFPIGHLHKSEVREIARQIGLPNADRKDSQGLCFVGKVAMADFLQKKIGKKSGNIILQDGTIVGKHDGAYQFTVGQRRGIGLHFQSYVTQVDVASNTVTVTKDPNSLELYRSVLGIRSIHWISGMQPTLPLQCMCKVRYRQELQACTVSKLETLKRGNAETVGNQIIVHLHEPQKGVPNGQIIVFYDGEVVLGCGEISYAQD